MRELTARELVAAIFRGVERWWSEYSAGSQAAANRELDRLVAGQASSYSLFPQKGDC